MGKIRPIVSFWLSFVLTIIVIFVAVPRTLAFDPIDQVCSTGVAGSTEESFLSHDLGQTFAPTKNILSSIGVYLEAFTGNNIEVTMKLVDAERTGATVVTKTATVTDQYSWVYFDLGDVGVTPDVAYGILLTSDGNVTWKQTSGSCYDRGYASWSSTGHPESDFGFATYGRDLTTQPVAPITTNQEESVPADPGVATAGTESTNIDSTDNTLPRNTSVASNKTSSKSTIVQKSKTPTADELKAAILKDFKANKSSSGGGMFLFYLSRLFWPVVIFFLIFFFCVGALILFVIIRRKNKQNNSPSSVSPQTTVLPTPEPESPQPEPVAPTKAKSEMSVVAKSEVHTAVQNPKKSSGKKKTGLIIALLIIVVLIILGVGGYLLVGKVKKMLNKSGSSTSPTASVSDGEFTASLKPIKADVDSDKSRSVTKTVSSAGAVLQTQGSDGTLYTLTVPVDATILPSAVTMTPLTNVPVSGYKNKVIGGVALTGSFDFIRPAYLTVQPNRQKSDKKLGFNYCAPGSRGFSPDVCAGMAGIPFTFGVAPGKIIAFASQSGEEDAQAFLEPTIYTGMKDTYTAQVLNPGAYFADNATKEDVEKFAQTTFALGADFTNKTEVLMHLATLGGKLDPYKSEIERFEREKKDYPREVLKSAILLRAIGNKAAAEQRTDDYYNTISKGSKNIRSSFVPIVRYAGVIRQIKASAAKQHRFATIKANPNIAYAAESVKLAIQDYVPGTNGGEENYDWPIPDYEGDNGVDYGNSDPPRTWQDIWNELFPEGTPTDLRDWSDIEAEAAEKKNADDELEKNSRDEINKENNTSCEKAQAVRTIIALGRMKGTDYANFSKIVGECAKKCTTMEECEDMGDMGDRWGNSGISLDARVRISDLLKTNQDCNLAKKEGLADYGKNSCEDNGDGSDLPESPPPSSGPPSLDL